MDILHLTGIIRSCLTQKQATEIPSYPISLTYSWLHPDLVIAAMTPGDKSLFSFQMLSPETKLIPIKPQKPQAYLMWLIKPYISDVHVVIEKFLNDILNGQSIESNKASFSLTTSGSLSDNFGERGCNWKILINGVEFGNFSIFSELIGRELADPVCICTINLEAFSSYSSETSVFEGWANGQNLDKFVASQAYKMCEPINKKRLLDEIYNNHKLNDYERIALITQAIDNKQSVIADEEKSKLQKSFLNSVDNIKRFNKQEAKENIK